MILTTGQLQAIKANITANGDLNALPNNDDGNLAIAVLYNADASPAFIVWRSIVPLTQVGSAFDAAELATRSTADSTRLQVIAAYLPAGVNASLAGVRQFFDDVFSGAGGLTTRTNLAAVWKRSARRIEKLFATGTGSTGSPATLVVEGTITGAQILEARNS